jgi:hypothetical protein
MAKIQIKHNAKAIEVYNGVNAYLDFCRDYGYVFDPDCYGDRSHFPYQQYLRMIDGKPFKDQWAEDARKFGRYIG